MTAEQLQEFKNRVDHWAGESQLACDGGFGSCPQNEPLDYWRGRRNALSELKAFLDRPELLHQAES